MNHWVLPLPVWAKREYDHSPTASWQILKSSLAEIDDKKPFCIYIHVPFCSTKCDFCDSYSFKLGGHISKHICEYVEEILSEIELWSQQGSLSKRPVSTIHFGGGTPAFLGSAELKRIVDAFNAHFNTSTETEWALETTVESLSPEMISSLHELGFRRIHVGVQSLQDDVRQVIGRRNSSEKVLAKIQTLREIGWIVSVDLICGLPRQSADGLLDDILNLIDVGVNGFSVYELLIYSQNRKWAERHGLINRDHLPNYLAFLGSASLLEINGFEKNLFNHWADPLDKNVYFTFPGRGEDCLAVGTIADGVFGDFHYRHPSYAQYLQSNNKIIPGIEGGLLRNAFENKMHPLHTHLLSGNIKKEWLFFYQLPMKDGKTLIDHWEEHSLIEHANDSSCRLTSNGSWFVGNMIDELNMVYMRTMNEKFDFNNSG